MNLKSLATPSIVLDSNQAVPVLLLAEPASIHVLDLPRRKQLGVAQSCRQKQPRDIVWNIPTTIRLVRMVATGRMEYSNYYCGRGSPNDMIITQ